MLERTLRLALGMPVQIACEHEDWLAPLGLPDARGEPPLARVVVQAGEPHVAEPPAAAERGTYWAHVRWRNAARAEFAVRGGSGALSSNDTDPTLVTLTVAPDAPGFALESALRILLSVLLAERGGFLVHASAVVIDGRAVLFLGHSTAGKTTTARRLGREGALRVADDIGLVWLGPEPRFETCHFDRAARLPGRAGAWPIAAAYAVQKNALTSRCSAASSGPLQSWSEALFTPPVNPAGGDRFLDALVQLAHGVPLRTLEAAARGALLPELRRDLNAIRPSKA
jgi:hypothetical protein